MAAVTYLLLVALLPNIALSAYVDMGIVNGTEARPHSRPYMVSVQRNGNHVCGGFLVSEHFVMTAAHCWNQEQKLTVVLGAHNLSVKKSSLNHVAVKFYHIHPKYNSTTFSSDIMLLQLNVTATKNKTINWISIPKKDENVKGKGCSVAGWGRRARNAPPSERLLEVDVSLTDKKTCQNVAYPVSNVLCARGRGGFCRGDSGGPLVCKKTAVGIVSFYIGDCSSQDSINAYTQISKFLLWIRGILGSMK